MWHVFRVFETEKNTPTQKRFQKTKSRPLQLHFGTSPSTQLQIVSENGTHEVEHQDFVLAQKWKYAANASNVEIGAASADIKHFHF